MIIGIDLHNIRDGGGINYIRNLLEASDSALDGFSEIHLFGSATVLANFPEKPWIHAHARRELERGLLHRLRFVAWRLPRLLREHGCDVLYSPGGMAFGNFRPYVTISRNVLPFQPELWAVYPRFSKARLRLQLLRRINTWTFIRADWMIFLSETAKRVISASLSRSLERVSVIPHGVNHDRFKPVKRTPDAPRSDRPIRIVYPSRLEPYKHQVEVVAAMAALLPEFSRLELHLCGPASTPYRTRVEAAMDRVDPARQHIRYLGEVPNAELPALYAESHLLVFASSCENLPNIMIEAMACGIPMCSSSSSPMPEIGKDACLYFDPTDPAAIAASIREALADYPTALSRAERAVEYAQAYSWERTARQTFAVITEAASPASR